MKYISFLLMLALTSRAHAEFLIPNVEATPVVQEITVGEPAATTATTIANESVAKDPAAKASEILQSLSEITPGMTAVDVGHCDRTRQAQSTCVCIFVKDAKTKLAFKKIFPAGKTISGTCVKVNIAKTLAQN